MRVYHSKRYLQQYLDKIKTDQKIGFVPTMGALHDGHLSLIKKAKTECNVLVCSIFVNPTQFDRKEDFDNYPSTLAVDLKALKAEKCDVVFIPKVKEMYPKEVTSIQFDFDGLDKVMEGAHRKGHFDGVGTIVKTLFEVVKPDMAFFGEKDFQQLQIVKKMVEKTGLPVQIVGNPIYREPDGLAMSSRNLRLTKEHRAAAPFIYTTLLEAKKRFETQSVHQVIEFVEQKFKSQTLLRLEYFSIAEEETLKEVTNKENGKKTRGFIAVYAGSIRLIDNIEL